jgi:hypothetical protein
MLPKLHHNKQDSSQNYLTIRPPFVEKDCILYKLIKFSTYIFLYIKIIIKLLQFFLLIIFTFDIAHTLDPVHGFSSSDSVQLGIIETLSY